MKTHALMAALLSVGMLGFAPAFGAETDPATLVPALEKGLWEAWKTKDRAAFETHLHQNALSVDNSGLVSGKAATLAANTSPACKVAGYTLGPMTAHNFGDSMVVLTYSATQNAVCDGKKKPPKVLVTAVWVKQGDKWLNATYHESPAPK